MDILEGDRSGAMTSSAHPAALWVPADACVRQGRDRHEMWADGGAGGGAGRRAAAARPTLADGWPGLWAVCGAEGARHGRERKGPGPGGEI